MVAQGWARSFSLPLYAVWYRLDAEFQRTHFGKLAVADSIWDYCLWHANLTLLQAREWDEFLSGFAHPRTWRPTWSDSASPRPRFPPPPLATQPKDEPVEGATIILEGLVPPKAASSP